MPGLWINNDVPALAVGKAFYTAAPGLTAGRRFNEEIVELLAG